jgi:hypothetical protein
MHCNQNNRKLSVFDEQDFALCRHLVNAKAAMNALSLEFL